MTDPDNSRRVEIKNDDDRTAAVAEVTTARGPEGTVRTSMYAKNEHVRRGDRATLVDEVMDLPEVKARPWYSCSSMLCPGKTRLTTPSKRCL